MTRHVDDAAATATKHYVRGSGLLFAGRCLALGMNSLIQILIVRYLSKEDYGAFSYGLAAITLLSTTMLCGLGKALPRVVSVHAEQQDYIKAFGSIALAGLSVASLGAVTVMALYGFESSVQRWLAIPPGVLQVLLILIVVAPLDALDHLMQHLAAIFCGARSIFLRRHVLGPSLKLSAIVLVTVLAGSVRDLAYGYVIASAMGVTLYAVMLARQWRLRGLLQYLRPSRLQLPVRELFGFSLPLASSDFATAIRGSLAALLLGYFGTLHEVADYRAALPLAGLNMIAAETFAFLFVPVASRLFARDDLPAMNTLYWHSSLWIAVLTLPVFVMTFALAGPLVAAVYGPDYRAAAPIVAVLSLGYYINAAVGFNAAILRVAGRLRTIVVNDIIAAAFCLVATTLLVRRFGAMGAAAGTTATFVVHNLLNYGGLGRRAVVFLNPQVVRLLGCIAVVAAAMVAMAWTWTPPLLFGVGVTAIASLTVVRLARGELNFDTTFPELRRIPMMRWLVRP